MCMCICVWVFMCMCVLSSTLKMFKHRRAQGTTFNERDGSYKTLLERICLEALSFSNFNLTIHLKYFAKHKKVILCLSIFVHVVNLCASIQHTETIIKFEIARQKLFYIVFCKILYLIWKCILVYKILLLFHFSFVENCEEIEKCVAACFEI